MNEAPEGFCYIGVKPCGCCVAATADRPEWREDTINSVKEFMEMGLDIERVRTEEARERLKRCDCGPLPVAGKGGDRA